MAATERRTSVSRRGMTVLGKVPIAPKPINLPSQRSTFSWEGSAGRFSSGKGVFGKFESALLDPVSSGEKLESKLVTPTGTNNHGGGVGLPEKKVQSVIATTTNMAFNNAGKMEEPRKSNRFLLNSSEGRKQEMQDPPLQRSGDGCLRGASIPPGFTHSGPHGNNARSVASTDPQCNGVGNGMPSDPSLQQNGSHNNPGMLYRSGTKDREIIVIHMVGGPGFYGNYPPQFGYPESYDRNGGVFGNFPLQFGNFEPMFGLPGHGGAHLSAAAGSEFFDEHEGFVCYEKECYKGPCHDAGRQRNGWVRGCNPFFGGVQGDTYDSLIAGTTPTIRPRSFSQRHLSRNAGRSRSLYRNGRVVSMEETTGEPVSEKRITLLTKVSQHGLQAKNSLKEIGGDKAVDPVSSAYLNEEFCEDEGKPPLEIFEAREVTGDTPVETSLPASHMNAETTDKATSPKENKMESVEDLLSKTTCNDKCLHCKGDPVAGGSATLLCQACEKTTVCESNFLTSQCSLEPTEEVPVATIGKDSCKDGCKADVKHIILDADNCSTTSIKAEVASKEREISMESYDSSIVSQSGNSEDFKSASLSSYASLEKNAKKHQKLVFKKKMQPKLLNKLGIRVSKAQVMTIKPGFQGNKVIPAMSSISSSDPQESLKVAKEDAVQNSDPSLTSQLSNSKVPKMSTSVSSVAPSKKNAERQQKLVYRKRLAEQAPIGSQASKNSSAPSEPAKSSPASAKADLGGEHEENRVTLTTAASTSKYHIIRRRVYHVVDGSEGEYYLPTAPLSSNDSGMQQLGKAKEKIVPTQATPSHCFELELVKFQEPIGENNCKGTSHCAAQSLQPSTSALSSNRLGDNAAKKHVRSGNQLSAWKPKVARQSAGSRNASVGKEKDGNTSASALVVEAPKEKLGVLCSALVGASNNLHHGEVDEKHLMEMTPEGFLSESKSSSSEPSECGDENQLSNQQDTLPMKEKCVEELLENVHQIEDVMTGSPNNVEELLPSSYPIVHVSEEVLAAKEIKQTSSQENVAGNRKPFIKKEAMSYEKANEFHQILIKRYKEKGKWKPKATLPKNSGKSKEFVLASQENKNASGWSYGN